jgi:hypothetical protein
MDALRSEYTLEREYGAADVIRATELSGQAQQDALSEILTGRFKENGRDQDLYQLLFFHAHQFRAALQSILKDSKAARRAIPVLAQIGVPEDLRLIIKHAPVARRELFEDRWAYDVACALLDPTTEAEWDFLGKCAANDFDDLWVDAGAIKTLRLIGSPRSVEVLREAARKNKNRQEMISRAIAEIDSGKKVFADPNLVEAGRRVAQAIKIGQWETNRPPRFNKEGDMALIDCEFMAGRDYLVHTATFHKIGDRWVLRGVRETSQALMAKPPSKEKFVGVWQGYSEDELEFARLDLKSDGTGALAVSFLPDSPADLYRVPRWSLDRYRLRIDLEPMGPEDDPIALEDVSGSHTSLNLVIKEVHGSSWSRKMTLYSEEEFQRRAGETRKRLESLPSKR